MQVIKLLVLIGLLVVIVLMVINGKNLILQTSVDHSEATKNFSKVRESMTDHLREAQDEFVELVINEIHEPWLRIVINYELDLEGTNYVHNRLGFYIIDTPNGLLEKEYLFPRLSDKDKPVVKFYEKYKKVQGNPWTTLDLEIDNTGQYRMNFKYDKPKRLNMIHDYDSNDRFTNYLEVHRTELTKLKTK